MLVFMVWCGSAAAQATAPCREGVTRDGASRLFEILNQPLAESACKFEGLAAGARVEARWSHDGVALPPLRAAARECAPASWRRAGLFRVDVPAEIAARCPSTAPLIAAFVEQLAAEEPSSDAGSLRPLPRAARALFVAIAALAIGLLARAAPRAGAVWDRRWLGLGLAGFAAALAVRAAPPFSLGNWYAEVLPTAGSPPGMRFGPGAVALQSLLRDLGLWNARGLIVSQLVIGAAAVPLLAAVLRVLRIELPAAAATTVLFVLAPFHVRLSAAAGEHLLASTLCLALLLAWLRAARDGDRLWLALTALLFPAVCLTRVEMAVQALLALAWPLCRDRIERAGGLPARELAARAALLAVLAAATLAVTYRLIALPARHPMPDLEGQLFALRLALPQFWTLATAAPGWIPLSSVVLALLGVVPMALRRPWLLLRVVATVVAAFAALGRLFMPDELLVARYFLFVVAIALIPAGFGFAALLTPVPARLRAPAAAVGLALLALWTGVAARHAYAARYAFEDEYAFLRGALAALPAGCTVYQLPLRSELLPQDLDCCLDLRRSPLGLAFPSLRFRALPDEAIAPFDGDACVAYYESIACAVRDEDPLRSAPRDRSEAAAAYFARRCAGVRAVGRFELLAETTTSPRATVNFFHGIPPRAALYRWHPADGAQSPATEATN